jgi:hypothetical protein
MSVSGGFQLSGRHRRFTANRIPIFRVEMAGNPVAVAHVEKGGVLSFFSSLLFFPEILSFRIRHSAFRILQSGPEIPQHLLVHMAIGRQDRPAAQFKRPPIDGGDPASGFPGDHHSGGDVPGIEPPFPVSFT